LSKSTSTAKGRAQAKSRAVSAKGVQEYRPKVPRALPVGAILNCADNTGAKELKILGVIGYKGRLRRLPSATVGDLVTVSVRKGTPELKGQVLPAVIVRQKKFYKRPDGIWIGFEDNSAVLLTPEGEPRGTEIRGPVALEAAERWPRVASISSIVV
jgi:large subunit ribosomal protein L14